MAGPCRAEITSFLTYLSLPLSAGRSGGAGFSEISSVSLWEGFCFAWARLELSGGRTGERTGGTLQSPRVRAPTALPDGCPGKRMGWENCSQLSPGATGWFSIPPAPSWLYQDVPREVAGLGWRTQPMVPVRTVHPIPVTIPGMDGDGRPRSARGSGGAEPFL